MLNGFNLNRRTATFRTRIVNKAEFWRPRASKKFYEGLFWKFIISRYSSGILSRKCNKSANLDEFVKHLDESKIYIKGKIYSYSTLFPPMSTAYYHE